MWRTTALIDAYKARLSIPSDYALAKHWGVSKQRISQYRRGYYTFSDERLYEVADALSLDHGELWLAREIERAEKQGSTATKDALSALLRRLGGMAACFLLFSVAPPPAADAQVMTGAMDSQLDNNTNYATYRRANPVVARRYGRRLIDLMVMFLTRLRLSLYSRRVRFSLWLP